MLTSTDPRTGASIPTDLAVTTAEVEPWTFGIDALYRSLAARGLLR